MLIFDHCFLNRSVQDNESSQIREPDALSTFRNISDMRNAPLDEVSWEIIEAFAASGAAEDAMLEFKGLLPEKNGKEHPWYSGRDQITDFTRDELAAEVVALANAYGGRLIIGIAETRDRPRKATGTVPLPRCGRFAEQFEQALRSLIDPPIGGLQVRAIIDPGTEDAGAVVIAVPASDLAPHGIGRPPAAYVRRGTSCEPMTMRDLQSVFWDARTKQQRIDAIRDKGRKRLRDLQETISTTGIPGTNRFDEVPKGSRGMFVRVQAIPQQSLEIGPLKVNSPWLLNICPDGPALHSQAGAAFAPAGYGYGWTPLAHGVLSTQVGPGYWTIGEDGVVSLIGFSASSDQLHAPARYVTSAAMVIAMSERLRRRAGRPDVPIEIDCGFMHDGTARAAVERSHSRFPAPENEFEIGPYLLTSRSTVAEVFEHIETQIWAGFSVPFVQKVGISFAHALSQEGWPYASST
ncbi:helix-turn-helix domain-containing protein [Bosea sp. RCC_152_1]|uniref:AlbA family DNA-binding domain-containing protein n=1 Tax=Bosea sp. RCC_152_1 TaxID=3239228 RepID=UPI0035258DE6